MFTIEELNNVNVFKEKTKDGDVIIDFFAHWCGPCKMFAPVFEETSKEFSDIKFFKVDTEKNPHTAQEFGVMSIPTIIFFKDGKEIDRAMGSLPKGMFIEKIKKVFKR